jgi:hypothetical protein
MTDGTEAGTSIVKDINVSNATAGSNPTSSQSITEKFILQLLMGLQAA